MNHTTALSTFHAQASNATLIRSAFGQMFNKAFAQARWRRIVAWITGRSTHLQSLPSTVKYSDRRLSGTRSVALDAIVGSEGRCHDFDSHFLPLKNHNRERWINIASARHEQVVLPPIELIHTDAGYFVRDGHHRVSVARVFGQATIEAIVA